MSTAEEEFPSPKNREQQPGKVFHVLIMCLGILLGSVLYSSEDGKALFEKVSSSWNNTPQQIATSASISQQMKSNVKHSGKQILTKEELTKFDGISSEFIYVAILGKVYDVSKAPQFYGKDGQYSFFAAKDATRSYLTGKSSDPSIEEHVEEVESSKLLSYYYKPDGTPTPEQERISHKIMKAVKAQKQTDAERAKFPSCNSHWKSKVGGSTWCSNPDLYPRIKDGRCACFSGTQIATFTDLELFPNCDKDAKKCSVPP